MPQVNYKTDIKRNCEDLWNYLTDSIYHPERYSANINSNSIIEHNETYVIRKIYKETSYKERIEIDYNNKKLKFVLIDHPRYRGCTNYQITKKNNDECELEVEIDWQTKYANVSEIEDEIFSKIIKNSALNIKEIAEEVK